NVGPVFSGTGCSVGAAQGVIYNPPGNLVPANAFYSGTGRTSGCTPYPSIYEGTTGLGSITSVQNIYSYQNLLYTPAEGMVVKNTGVTWWAALVHDAAGNYLDSVLLLKGQFDSIAGDMVYTLQTIYVPLCTDTTILLYSDMDIVWSDDGVTGYLAILGNDWVCNTSPTDTT